MNFPLTDFFKSSLVVISPSWVSCVPFWQITALPSFFSYFLEDELKTGHFPLNDSKMLSDDHFPSYWGDECDKTLDMMETLITVNECVCMCVYISVKLHYVYYGCECLTSHHNIVTQKDFVLITSTSQQPPVAAGSLIQHPVWSFRSTFLHNAAAKMDSDFTTIHPEVF